MVAEPYLVVQLAVLRGKEHAGGRHGALVAQRDGQTPDGHVVGRHAGGAYGDGSLGGGGVVAVARQVEGAAAQLGIRADGQGQAVNAGHSAPAAHHGPAGVELEIPHPGIHGRIVHAVGFGGYVELHHPVVWVEAHGLHALVGQAHVPAAVVQRRQIGVGGVGAATLNAEGRQHGANSAPGGGLSHIKAVGIQAVAVGGMRSDRHRQDGEHRQQFLKHCHHRWGCPDRRR